MPTYDYVCDNCGHELEAFQSITANPLRKCPECGKLKLKRKIGAGAGLIFKGSGFYITDYRSSEYQKRAEADQKAASGDTGKKSDSDSKSTSAKDSSASTKKTDKSSGGDSSSSSKGKGGDKGGS